MKKTKVFISLMLIFFTGIGIVIGYLLTSEMNETYMGIATVIERRSASEVVVKLNTEPEEKIENELIVYSNIFTINDQLKIEYYKNGRNYVVTKVESIIETDNQKADLATKIMNDPTIIKYLNLVSIKSTSEKNYSTDIIGMPTKLSNQELILISEEEYFRYYYSKFDTNFIYFPKDTEITFSLLKDFKVASVENVKDGKRLTLPYKATNRSITFDSMGEGLYSVKLSFKNGDVINYIFV